MSATQSTSGVAANDFAKPTSNKVTTVVVPVLLKLLVFIAIGTGVIFWKRQRRLEQEMRELAPVQRKARFRRKELHIDGLRDIKMISWHQMTRVLNGPAPNGILSGLSSDWVPTSQRQQVSGSCNPVFGEPPSSREALIHGSRGFQNVIRLP